MRSKVNAMVVLATLAAAALLSACAGSSSSSTEVKSAADAAIAIGCSSSSPASTEEIFVTDLVTCAISGEEVKVYYFSTPDALDSYVEIAGQFGGQYLAFPTYLVQGTPDVLEEIQKSAGGTIRP